MSNHRIIKYNEIRRILPKKSVCKNTKADVFGRVCNEVNNQLDRGIIQEIIAIFYNLSGTNKMQDHWILYLAGVFALLSVGSLYCAKKLKEKEEIRREKRMSLLFQNQIEEENLRFDVAASLEPRQEITVPEKAMTLFSQHYIVLSNSISKTVQQRAEMITQMAIIKLSVARADAYEILSDPDVQRNLQIIQKEFASSGDEHVAHLLIDVFLDSVKQPRNTLAQSLANDALSVLGRLTKQQLDIISLLFILKYTRDSKNSCLTSIQQYTTKYIMPFCDHLTREVSTYRHIEYYGCTQMGSSPIALEGLLLGLYPAVFQYMGFSREEMKESVGEELINEELLVPSLFDSQLWKLNGIDDQMTKNILLQAGLSGKIVTAMEQLQQSRPSQCTEEGIRLWLPHIDPQLSELSEIWNQSPLQVTQLRVLGVYIAQINIKRQINENFDIGAWL